jgi:hypothetical protein
MTIFVALMLIVVWLSAVMVFGQVNGTGNGNCWLVFISSTPYNGNLGGLAGADAICRMGTKNSVSICLFVVFVFVCRSDRRHW